MPTSRHASMSPAMVPLNGTCLPNLMGLTTLSSADETVIGGGRSFVR